MRHYTERERFNQGGLTKAQLLAVLEDMGLKP